MNLWCKKFPEKLNFVPATTKPTPVAFLNCISVKIKLKEIVPKRSDQVLLQNRPLQVLNDLQTMMKDVSSAIFFPTSSSLRPGTKGLTCGK